MTLRVLVVTLAVCAITTVRTSAEPTSQAIDSLFDAGQYERVTAVCEEFLSQHPERGDILFMQIRAGILGGMAAEYLTDTTPGNPADAYDVFRSGIACYLLGRTQRAAHWLRQAADLAPDWHWVDYYQGRIHADHGEDSLAIEALRRSQADPSCIDAACFQEGRLYLMSNEIERADSMYSLITPLTQHDFRGRTDLLWWIGVQGDWSRARDGYTKLLSEHPSRLLYSGCAWLYRNVNRYDEALQFLDHALEIWPKNLTLQAERCEYLAETGHWEGVDEFLNQTTPLQRAILDCPVGRNLAATLNDPVALEEENQATILFGEFDTHIFAAFLEWVRERRGLIAYDSLLATLGRDRPPWVVPLLQAQRSVGDDGEHVLSLLDGLTMPAYEQGTARRMRIECLFSMGDVDAAVAIAEKEHQRIPGGSVGLHLAKWFDLLERPDLALQWVDSVAVRQPSDISVHLARLALFDNASLSDSCIALWEDLASLHPTRVETAQWAGELFAGEESGQRLQQYVNGLSQNSDLSPAVQFQLARLLTLLAEYDTADSILVDLERRYPSSAHVPYYRGYVRTVAGEPAAAKEFYAKAQAIDPMNTGYQMSTTSATHNTTIADSNIFEAPADSTNLSILDAGSARTLAQSTAIQPEDKAARIILDKWQYLYFADGTRARRVHRMIKLANERGLSRFGTVALGFNAWRETPKLITARTIGADGTIVEVPHDQVSIFAGDEPDFDDARSLGFAFPHLDSGATIEYLVQFDGHWDRAEDLFNRIVINEFDPIERSVIELTVPKHWKIKHAASAGMSIDSISQSDTKSFIWSVSAVEAVELEEDGPSLMEQCEWIRYAYSKSWRAETDWYWGIVKPKLQSDTSLLQLAARLLEGTQTHTDTVSALYDYVTQEIRYVAIDFGTGAIIPRIPEVVVANRYGDCKDKSALLISLLEMVSISAHPALITSDDETLFDTSFADIAQFDHMIVYLPELDLFLDPTCSVCPMGMLLAMYRGQPTLIVGDTIADPLRYTHDLERHEEGLTKRIRVVADTAGGADIDVSMRFWGGTAEVIKSNEPYYDPTAFREFVKSQGEVDLWDGCEFLDYDRPDMSDSGLVAIWNTSWRNDSLFLPEMVYAVPTAGFQSLTSMMELPDTSNRSLDIDLGRPFIMTLETTIVPQEPWILQNPRHSWIVDTTWFVMTSSTDEWADSSRLTTVFELKKSRLSRAEFGSFLGALDACRSRIVSQTPWYRLKPDADRINSLQSALRQNPNDISLAIALSRAYTGPDGGGFGCYGVENRKLAKSVLRGTYERGRRNEALVMTLASLEMYDERVLAADSILRDYGAGVGESVMLTALQLGIQPSLGDHEATVALLEANIEDFPGLELRAALIIAYAKAGQPEKAKKQLELFELLQPEPDLLLSTKLQYYAAIEDRDSPLQLLQDEAGDTTKLENKLKWSEYYLLIDNHQDALRLTRELLVHQPDNSGLLNNYAWHSAHSGGDLEVALEYAQRAVTLDGGCGTGSRNTLGVVYYMMSRYEQAQEELKYCLRNEAADSRALNHYYLGLCYAQLGDQASARTHLTATLEGRGERRYRELAADALATLDDHR